MLTLLAASPLVAFGMSAACGSSSSGGSSNGGGTPAAVPSVAQPDCKTDGGEWPMFGQNICNTASQEIAGGIDTGSVSKLAVKWSFGKAQGAGEVSATPAIVGGSVYFPDWSGKINRLDAATGAV
jgi:polyvinyl alcohol dehydrogenase (cytochrome)